MDQTRFILLITLPIVFANRCAIKKSCCVADFTSPLCNNEVCSCDISCRLQGTCCQDYSEFCWRSPPEPCVYSEWEPWSACSTSQDCDIGFQTRQRSVLQTGNFRSHLRCNNSALTESQACGDLDCYRHRIKEIYEANQFARDHFDYWTALYQYQSGQCDHVVPHQTTVCIMCTDESRCGEPVIKKGQFIKLYSNSCSGTWKKRSETFYRKPCHFLLRSADIFAFEKN